MIYTGNMPTNRKKGLKLKIQKRIVPALPVFKEFANRAFSVKLLRNCQLNELKGELKIMNTVKSGNIVRFSTQNNFFLKKSLS
jgi:hypothetical protein